MELLLANLMLPSDYPHIRGYIEGDAMRIEATVPDSRGQVLEQLADELGLSKSQVVDEAVAIFIQAVSAVRGGRRLVAVAPDERSAPDCLITTPTLSALEWTSRSEALQISPQALERVRALIAAPPAPSPRARAAAARFKAGSPQSGK